MDDMKIKMRFLMCRCCCFLQMFIKVTPSLAKLLLHTLGWSLNEIVSMFRADAHGTLVTAKVKPANNNVPKPLMSHQPPSLNNNNPMCPVCYAHQPVEYFKALACGHQFCKECWATHFEVQVIEGISTSKSGQIFYYILYFINTFVDW